MLSMSRRVRPWLALLAVVSASVFGAVACTPARPAVRTADGWLTEVHPAIGPALPALAQFTLDAPGAATTRATIAPPPLPPGFAALGLPAAVSMMPDAPQFIAPRAMRAIALEPDGPPPIARIPGDGPWMPGDRIVQSER